MRKLIKPKPIWIALILSLFIHFFLISRFNYLLEVSYNNKIMEKSYVARISLKLKTDLSFPIENSGVPNLKSIPDFQNIENRDTEKQILHMEEKPLREDKKISMDNDQLDKNRKVKAETEKSLATGDRETEKEAEQEKERNLPIQSKNNEYFKEKPVQRDFNIASQEADYKNEGQAKKNPEIEKTLDFTTKNYPDNANPPELLEFQRPVYPKDLRERDVEGKVILKILIDKEGKVQEIQIFESSGYETFDQIAVKSVWQWRFKAARKENQQRESWVLIPINFQIK